MARALMLTTTAADTRWSETYETLAFTAFALRTQADDPAIGPLHRRLQGVLADWEHIEAERRGVRAAALTAKAQCQVADAALDMILTRIAHAILTETDQDRQSALYTRFFPEPHEAVVELGLDGELPAASVVMAQLDEGGDMPETLTTHITPLRQTLTVAHGALGALAESYAHLGRLQARVEAWFEGADASIRFIHKRLHALGEERGLSYRWTASFFVDGTPTV
jgi:hypothetical protein